MKSELSEASLNSSDLSNVIVLIIVFLLLGGGPILLTIKVMWEKLQDRKIKEAEARIKIAELELKKEQERNRPKSPYAMPNFEDVPYEQGLAALQSDRE